MQGLPRRIEDIRTMLNVINWRGLESEIDRETRSRLVIVGPVNAGKSSLFNALQGRDISEVSPIPGTTRNTISEAFGPFTLIDTPGLSEAAAKQHHEITQQAIVQADAVILLLDAVAGVRQADVELYEQLKQKGKPVLVALNKVDEIPKRDLPSIVNDAEHKLGTGVIAVSAKTGEGIAEGLIPAVMELNPKLAVAIGRALPAYRHTATNRVIREAAAIAGGIGLEPLPFLDLPLLLGHQLRMVLRIAAIYGESFTIRHARELISAIAGGMGIRYVGEQAAKFLPGPGWLISAGFAAGGTFAIGKAAEAYFESGKQLKPPQLQALYKRLRRNGKTSQ
jgi:small GTP-binding protein